MSSLDPQPDAPAEPAPRERLEQIGCPLVRPGDLTQGSHEVDWLWHGYLARHQITLLTGQWKIGKTALLAALLARLGPGGALAGRCPQVVQIPNLNAKIPNNIQSSTRKHAEFASALDFKSWWFEVFWRLLIGVWAFFQSPPAPPPARGPAGDRPALPENPKNQPPTSNEHQTINPQTNAGRSFLEG